MVGCGGGDDFPDPVPVSGTVNHGGKPVAGASVTFRAKGGEGRSASGMTDSAGKFTLTTFSTADGAIPGDYVVTVSKSSGAEGGDDMDLGDDGDPSAGYDEAMAKAGGDEPEEVDSTLPVKYASAATSGLERTVGKSGKNEFAIDLE